jgi:hypothetical protein
VPGHLLRHFRDRCPTEANLRRTQRTTAHVQLSGSRGLSSSECLSGWRPAPLLISGPKVRVLDGPQNRALRRTPGVHDSLVVPKWCLRHDPSTCRYLRVREVWLRLVLGHFPAVPRSRSRAAWSASCTRSRRPCRRNRRRLSCCAFVSAKDSRPTGGACPTTGRKAPSSTYRPGWWRRRRTCSSASPRTRHTPLHLVLPT